jgi:hypothetical protein
MRINRIKIHGTEIAEVKDDGILILEVQDALDLMAEAGNLGAERIIIREHNFTQDFFNLKTGLAGEILQKFSNYGMRLAVIGDYSKYTSGSLKDFIRESNRLGKILFVNDQEQAISKLTADRRFISD